MSGADMNYTFLDEADVGDCCLYWTGNAAPRQLVCGDSAE